MLRYLPLITIIVSVTIYHVSQKNVPKQANPWAVLSVAYALAFLFSFLMWAPWKTNEPAVPLSQSLFMAFLLAIACVGIEAGYLFAYQSGWQITRLASLASAGISVTLLIVGTLFFGETMSVKVFLGFLLTAVGVTLMQLK